MRKGKGHFADVAIRYAEQAARPRIPEVAIPACWQIKAACERFLTDVEGDEWVFDAAKVQRVCQFAEGFPYLDGTLAAKKLTLRLEPWQVFILAAIFGVVDHDGLRKHTEAFVFIPRKNGKSTFAAIIAQYMLVWRATDLIMRLTGDGLVNVMIRNTDDGGASVCIVQAALGDRYGVWAEVRIAGHVEGIALDQLRLLKANAPAKPKGKDLDASKVELTYHFEAELFRDEFSKHANWRIDGMTINADGLGSGIRLHAISPASAVRVPREMPDTNKTVALHREGMASILTYVAAASSGKQRGKLMVAMPDILCAALDDGKLYLSMPRTQAERACIGSGTHAPDPDQRQLSVADMKRVAEVLFDLGVEATGCFIDDDVTDVALRLRADLDGASLTIIIPTRSDQTVNETLRWFEVA